MLNYSLILTTSLRSILIPVIGLKLVNEGDLRILGVKLRWRQHFADEDLFIILII